MMHRAARSRSAFWSTTTGGLPGPAAMTRLPYLLAAATTIGPPVTHSSATLGCWNICVAVSMLGSCTVVSTLATPHSRSISRLKSCSAYCATRLPDGCGAKIAVLPAARMLIALAAMVGTECVTGSDMPITPHGACSIMHSPDLSLRASVCIASTPST